jgi:PIN domain nuclease of toxin-antitoxin system
VKHLLDTHVWLWIMTAPERLGSAYEIVADPATELVLSVVSCWEIAIKSSIGRLQLPLPVPEYLSQRIRSTGVSTLPIDVRHASAVASLPLHHRDPFDRMLVSQAMVEGLPIITADAAIAAYDCEVVRLG